MASAGRSNRYCFSIQFRLNNSEVHLEPLDCCLECTFFARFDLLIAHIPTNRKTVGTAFKVFSLVTRRELATAENLIGCCLCFERELFVNRAAVD